MLRSQTSKSALLGWAPRASVQHVVQPQMRLEAVGLGGLDQRVAH